jgi:hypothetical protein
LLKFLFSISNRRRKGEKLFLVAFYECDEDYELENLESDRLYCSKEKWVGGEPKCMPINDEDDDEEDDEGGEGECDKKRKRNGYECTHYDVGHSTLNLFLVASAGI